MVYIGEQAIGTTNETAPTELKAVGAVDESGKLQPVKMNSLDEVIVREDNTTEVIVADITGPATLNNQDLPASVNLLFILMEGADGGRASGKGATVSSSSGIPCLDGAAQVFPVTTSKYSVYVPSGATAKIWGFGKS